MIEILIQKIFWTVIAVLVVICIIGLAIVQSRKDN